MYRPEMGASQEPVGSLIPGVPGDRGWAGAPEPLNAHLPNPQVSRVNWRHPFFSEGTMTDTNDSPSSGEPREPSWARGSWTPPPPPPDWREPGSGWRDPGPGWRPPASGWHDPSAGWNDPRYGDWGGQGHGGHGGQGGPPPGYPYWGSPYQGGWGPGGPGGPRGWGYGWAPSRPRRSLPHAVTALLLVVAVLVG